MDLFIDILLVFGMLGITLGCAIMAVAESNDSLHKASHNVTGLGLVYLGLATLVSNLS